MSLSYPVSWSSIRMFLFSILPSNTLLLNLDIHNFMLIWVTQVKVQIPTGNMGLYWLIQWVEVVKTIPQLAGARSLEKLCAHSQEKSMVYILLRWLQGSQRCDPQRPISAYGKEEEGNMVLTASSTFQKGTGAIAEGCSWHTEFLGLQEKLYPVYICF